MAINPKPCDTGRPVCGEKDARLYPCGWRCDAHRPGASPVPPPTVS